MVSRPIFCDIAHHLPITHFLGQGFLKIGLVLQEIRDPYDLEKSPVKKKTPKDGGIRRTIMIGVVEDVPESYYNVRILLEILDIQPGKIDVKYTSDLKLLNILLGRESSIIENQELTQIFIKYMHDIVLKAQSFKICRNVEMKKCSYEEKK